MVKVLASQSPLSSSGSSAPKKPSLRREECSLTLVMGQGRVYSQALSCISLTKRLELNFYNHFKIRVKLLSRGMTKTVTVTLQNFKFIKVIF